MLGDRKHKCTGIASFNTQRHPTANCGVWTRGKNPLCRLLIWGSWTPSFISLSQEAGPWARHEAFLSSIQEMSEQMLCNGPISRGGGRKTLQDWHPRETAPQPLSEMKTRWDSSPCQSRQIFEMRKQQTSHVPLRIGRLCVLGILGNKWLLRFNELSR